MKNYAFLFWGYLVVWAGLATYLVLLGRRLTQVGRRIDRLEARSRAGDAPRAT